MPERQRADARRNYTRILAVAEEEVATHGADASLEQIARTAGLAQQPCADTSPRAAHCWKRSPGNGSRPCAYAPMS